MVVLPNHQVLLHSLTPSFAQAEGPDSGPGDLKVWMDEAMCGVDLDILHFTRDPKWKQTIKHAFYGWAWL